MNLRQLKAELDNALAYSIRNETGTAFVEWAKRHAAFLLSHALHLEAENARLRSEIEQLQSRVPS